MRKKIHTFSLIAFTFSLAAAQAAVTQRWTVETSRVQPVVFEAVHGETLALEASFKSYGEPVEMPLNGCSILWQTNGMGGAWWSAGAEVSLTNRVSATFTPAMDPGAASVVGFIGATGQNYRAAFTIRFRHGPGADPSVIQPPVRTLDFATTAVAHPEDAPWSLKGGAGGVTAQQAGTIATNTVEAKVAPWAMKDQPQPTGEVTAQQATNIAYAVVAPIASTQSVHTAYLSSHSSQLSQLSQDVASRTTTNDVNAILASSNLCTVAAAQSMTNALGRTKRDKTDFSIPDVITPFTYEGTSSGSPPQEALIAYVQGYRASTGREFFYYNGVIGNPGWMVDGKVPGPSEIVYDGWFYHSPDETHGPNSEIVEIVFKKEMWGGEFISCTITATRSVTLSDEIAKVSQVSAHTNRTDNPHGVTANQVGAYTQLQIDGTTVTNGGAKAYADATFVAKTGAVVRTNFKLREYENDRDIIRKDTSVDGGWHFLGVSDSCESVGSGNDIYIKLDNREIVFDTSGFDPSNASRLSPDRSPVATSNMVERVIASKPAPSPLSGRTYDFANGSNFVKNVYTALTNVIQTLGGTVTNPPSF